MDENCENCGKPFKPDPVVASFNDIIGEGVPMERHGEAGRLRAGPRLCDACCQLPPKELAAVINRLMRRSR